MTFDQIIIFLTGMIAIWLVNDKREHYRKYSSIFGLIGQPFWFYTTYIAEQWGIFFLTIFYTIAWGRWFYYSWIFKEE
jgi:hypothetical protein